MKSQDKHVVVVTGGGRGIGRAIAKTFATQSAAVALIARSTNELNDVVAEIRDAGFARPFPVDIRDLNSISKTIAEIEESMGPITVLVNNAGILGPIGPFVENDFEDWWHAMEVNLRGAAFCMHVVLKRMISRCRGRVVNISSGGANSGIAHFSSYVTAKTALVRLTECVANEIRPFGISIFAVNPGTVRTKMSQHSLDSPEGQKWFPWFREIFENGLDLSPESVAQFVVELASGKADALSGNFLHPGDDLDSILKMKETVQQEKLYTLRLRTQPVTSNPSAFGEIRVASEAGAGIYLRLEQMFFATREKLFDIWTNPEAIQEWFISPNLHEWVAAPISQCIPGGKFSFIVQKNEQRFHLYGTYIEVKYPERLSFTWQWDDDTPIPGAPCNTVVNIDFIENQMQTNLVLTHARFPNEDARNAHESGWERCFDNLTKLLEAF